VVLVNDDPISDYDIEQRERFLAITTQEKPSPVLKKKATEMLIEERLQLQEGRKQGITAAEEDVTKVMAGMGQKNNMSADQLAGALGQMGVNIKTLQDRIRATIVWQRVVQRKFRHDVTIGESDVDKALADSGGGEMGEKTLLSLRQVRFEVSSSMDQGTIAKQIATIEGVRAKLGSCGDVPNLTKGIDGIVVKALSNQQPNGLPQPARTLVMHAKVGQMTPPVISGAGIEAYAVCGKQVVKGDPAKRQEAQRSLLEQEFGLRAEGLLRDLRQDAFIEYR
jgi:peptidyl-prolyl cis-trans isomerase SurA